MMTRTFAILGRDWPADVLQPPLHCVGASSSLICYVVRRDERHNLRRYRPVCSICDHAVNAVEYRTDNLLAKRRPAFTHMKHIVMLICTLQILYIDSSSSHSFASFCWFCWSSFTLVQEHVKSYFCMIILISADSYL